MGISRTSGNVVRAIQSGQKALAIATETDTVTITEVSDKAFLMFSFTCAVNDVKEIPRGVLTNTTTLTFTSITSTGERLIEWQVIDPY